MALSRSTGQSSAANRRAPVIDWLKIVRGAWKETAEVWLRTPLERVRTSAPGMPAASAATPSAVRKAATGTSGSVVGASSTGLRWGRECRAQGASMPRSSGSVVRTLCIRRIAEMPSTRAWWIFV